MEKWSQPSSPTVIAHSMKEALRWHCRPGTASPCVRWHLWVVACYPLEGFFNLQHFIIILLKDYVNLSNYFWNNWANLHKVKIALIPMWMTQSSFKCNQIKTKILHVNLVVFVNFKSNVRAYKTKQISLFNYLQTVLYTCLKFPTSSYKGFPRWLITATMAVQQKPQNSFSILPSILKWDRNGKLFI